MQGMEYPGKELVTQIRRRLQQSPAVVFGASRDADYFNVTIAAAVKSIYGSNETGMLYGEAQ